PRGGSSYLRSSSIHRVSNADYHTGMSRLLQPGTVAPDFELQSAPEEKLALHDLRGKPVILAFYPADFSPVCGDEMALYNAVLPEFHKLGAELIGISVDGAW